MYKHERSNNCRAVLASGEGTANPLCEWPTSLRAATVLLLSSELGHASMHQALRELSIIVEGGSILGQICISAVSVGYPRASPSVKGEVEWVGHAWASWCGFIWITCQAHKVLMRVA